MVTRGVRNAARARRGARIDGRVDWFGEQIAQGIEVGMLGRVRFAAQFLRDKIVFNISDPVTKLSGGRVVDRSVAGEFPKADSTRLLKDIFFRQAGSLTYHVGTTLDYGLILETRMDRSFILRTFDEERQNIRRILIAGRGVPNDSVIFDDRLP